MSFRTSFLAWSLKQFPELSQDFEGVPAKTRLHFAFLVFRNHTQAAIDNHDRRRLVELFEMADRVLACAYPKMRSLFHVVYVEDLHFHDHLSLRSWAIELLTPRFREERDRSLPGLPRDVKN